MLDQATIETTAVGRSTADFPASETIAGPADAGIVILCDHASNAIPADYADLGVARSQLGRHIAYDIGAAGITRGLAAALGVPAVLSTYSRLLIDPNRGRDDPTMVMRLSDGAIVPGNARIGEDEIARRVTRYYEPYHAAITAQIDAGVAAGKPPVLFSIHSFTPVWKQTPRRWQVGVLWDCDPRFAVPLIEALESEGDLEVGDNEPYRGSLKGDCLHRHGTGRGLAHALIEIRQDLIADADGVSSWAERLARLVRPLMARDGFHDIVHYGSHSD